MKGKILVTDSLFIFDEHVEQLGGAGYEVERLDKAKASEAELCEAIKGKVGYILGGVEEVTDKVLESADELKAIVFTGADWPAFIPSHETASRKGIAIANAPGANTFAVSEFTVLLILMMLRHVVELGSVTGDKSFLTGRSVSEVRIGIVGLGRIGRQVARMLKGLGAKDVVYWSRHRKADLEQGLGITYVPLEEVISSSDVITNHLSSAAGQFFDSKLLAKTKKDSILINTGYHKSFDMDALYGLLVSGKNSSAFDCAVSDPRFTQLPLSVWFSTKENAAYNTHLANRLGSDMAVESLLNILATGDDQNLVNPEYKQYRKT